MTLMILRNMFEKSIGVHPSNIEEAKINIQKINVNNSELGIASKDGSIANISNVNIQNVDTCLGSYNKKKEFSGGYIKINKFNCNNFIKKNILDSQSRILLEN